MKKILIQAIALLFFTLNLSAQELLPFATSNYAGVSGVHLQPASIADSRFSFDLAVSSTSFSITNNFYGIDPYVIWHPKLIQDLDFRGEYLTRNLDGNDKHGLVSLKQDFFSFMISLSEKDAIAFTPSLRAVYNLNNMTESMAVLIDNYDQETNLWDIRLKNENLNSQVNMWAEYGFTYARVILDKEKHFLKAGTTLKINQGIGSGYMFMKDLTYEVNDQDTLSIYNTYTNYGASDNIDEEFNYQFNTNPSLAFDFGVVYEFRPEWMKYRYEMDGKTNLSRRDKNKYLFKIGVSLTDLGNVRYRRNPLSKDFNADIHKLYTDGLEFSSVADLNAFIDTNFVYYDVPDKYTMKLPLSLSFQADVRVAEGFYVNITPYIALNRGTNTITKVHYLSAFNFIPRYDLKWFGISLPVQYTSFKEWNFGLGLRLGSFWIGSNDLFNLLISDKERYGTSASVVFKVPIYYSRPHDIDNDKISDRRDACPEIAGIAALEGCPDTDLDGITDANDKCPQTAGLKELNGCPDADTDGITDALDECPEMKGLAAFNGCPDSDGDSIIDSKDACPFSAGLADLLGCPDQDEDGIADKDDNCPTVAGTRENKGCPFIDSDGDGIRDESDNCPGVKGPVDNQGCPYQDTDKDSIPDKDDDCPSIPGSPIFKGCPDTDNDGISDKYDLCPTLPGIAENKGCPEIKKEEREVLLKAFSNLEFETGKSVIRKSSHGSLNELAQVMKNRSEFKLLLAGHTDNVGNAASNLSLSKNRTLAVKSYLVKKGIEADRIRIEWFGQTKPVASNSTPEGRQQNRRVEMTISFE